MFAAATTGVGEDIAGYADSAEAAVAVDLPTFLLISYTIAVCGLPITYP